MATPRKIQCQVSSIKNHGDNVSVISLKPVRRLPKYAPGQFLHLALDPYNPMGGFWPESRVFSIASAPFELKITLAYAVKGAFTQRMRQELKVGGEVWVKLPYGHFTCSASAGDDIVLIAGGTGITPYISFLSSEIHKASSANFTLVYGVRSPEQFLFEKDIAKISSSLKDFKFLAFCEEQNERISVFPAQSGRLSIDMLWQAVGKPKSTVFYLSGPIAMIENFKQDLSSRGVCLENIRIDEWE